MFGKKEKSFGLKLDEIIRVLLMLWKHPRIIAHFDSFV